LQRILLLSAANATLDWFDRTGPRSVEDLAAALTEQFWSGIAAEPAAPDRSGASPAENPSAKNPSVHDPRGTATTP